MKQGKDANDDRDIRSSDSSNYMVKISLAIILLISFIALLILFRDQLTLTSLAKNETWLRRQQQANPLLSLGVAFFLYVVVTGLSLPGAAVLSLSYGWLFGFFTTVILVSFASTTGATIAFLLSRYLLREAVQRRFGDRLTGFNEALKREGAFYLFTLRLIPAAPFFVINVVMGLTPIRVRTFWWVSQLGMIPGTCVYVYAGSSVPQLAEIAERGTSSIMKPELFAAFIFLGLFPIAAKKAITWLQTEKSITKAESESNMSD